MSSVRESLPGDQPFSLTSDLPTTCERLRSLAEKIARCAQYLPYSSASHALFSMENVLTRLDTGHMASEMEYQKLPEKGVKAAELREKLLEETPAITGDPLDPFDVELRLRKGDPATEIDIHALAKTPDFMRSVISGGLVKTLELTYNAREELELPFDWEAPFCNIARMLFHARAPTNITEEAAQEVVTFFKDKGFSVENPQKGERPLEVAIKSLSHNFLKALIANGASITTGDFYFLVQLTDMVMQSSDWFWDCKLQMLKILCENETALGTYKEECKKFEKTPLEVAVASIQSTFSDCSYRDEFISFVYEKLSDPERYNSLGNPPIFDLLEKVSLPFVEAKLEQYLSTHKELLSTTSKEGISLLGHCFLMGGTETSWLSQKALIPIVSILSGFGNKLNKFDIERVCSFLVYRGSRNTNIFKEDSQIFLAVWAKFWDIALDSEEGLQNLEKALSSTAMTCQKDGTEASHLEACLLYMLDGATPPLLLFIIEKIKKSNFEPLRQLLLNARLEEKTILFHLSKIRERLTPHQDRDFEAKLDEAIAYLKSISVSPSKVGTKRPAEGSYPTPDLKRVRK